MSLGLNVQALDPSPEEELRALRLQLKQFQNRVEELNQELDRGDSWTWIRQKFEKCRTQFKWYTPRTDGLVNTRYEVMGWLHVLFAHADPKVYIDIAIEHRTDEAEALVAALRIKIARLTAPVSKEELTKWQDLKSQDIGNQDAINAIIAGRARE
jgi:hypothetical protein